MKSWIMLNTSNWSQCQRHGRFSYGDYNRLKSTWRRKYSLFNTIFIFDTATLFIDQNKVKKNLVYGLKQVDLIGSSYKDFDGSHFWKTF